MTVATVSSAGEPMSEMNTTPLIDVLLVLLVMLIMTVPISTHTLEVDLPGKGKVGPNPVKNSLVVTARDRLEWNGRPVNDAQLGGLLVTVRAMRPEPEVQFEPDASASYDRTAKVLQIVKASRVSRFGFVGNEKYRVFGRGE